jgi:ribonuclease HI
MEHWKEYTDSLIKEISNLPQSLIFILLGDFAKKKAKCVDPRHTLLTWSHPSPINRNNTIDSPKNFKYCDAFVKTNDILEGSGLCKINWDPDLGYVRLKQLQPLMDIWPLTNITKDELWIFTDGGAVRNGKHNCVASWAYWMTDGVEMRYASNLVTPVNIPGEVFKTSNNRGELTAILFAMNSILAENPFTYKCIKIVSDSDISIKGIDKRGLENKKNVDLLQPAKDALANLRTATTVTFHHTNSHKVNKHPAHSLEWFIWHGNNIADALCGISLENK